MSATLQGINLALRSTRTVRTLKGIYTVYTYEGTKAACEAAVSGLSYDQEWEIDDSQAPLTILSIRTPDDAAGAWVGTTAFNDTYQWEILANDVQKDLYQHPEVLALGWDWIAALREWFKNPEYGKCPFTDATDPIPDVARRVYSLLMRESTHYLDTEYVARLTRTVGSRYAVNTADTNILALYTTAQMINEAGVNGTPIPSRLQFKINAIPSKSVTSPPIDSVCALPLTYLWSWLKKPSTEIQRTDGKIQITTEWWLDLWCNNLYPIAT